ncbi:hypothetical protein AWL63_18740 [Sphingomonas panacis]|uniref:VWFD domain-containing protein n=1 Tax=Sphingomonas panacis TaxID=1560345 RepID=A0A1B3ZE30_9SPHN|nr:hypothetical protein [Sphingomonas panacis]AOH85671.1 hypothetical protein AWL63_18740 [Sphingomonas panacis]
MKPAWLLLAAIALLASIPAAAQTVEDRARAAAEAARAKTGDSDALQQNYVTPGLAGQPIATIDNSRTFNPNIACQKTATVLELLAQPVSTGDIGTLRVSRDKDLDGSVDQTLNLPMSVSGICANGVISCQPGSWNGCHSFKWDVAPSGDLKLTEVDLTQLAGCYCVNNSCGTNLVWGNMASVLKDLGGGVIGALTTADPRIGIAQAVIDGLVIRYVGAQTTACAASPSIGQTAYRANPAAIQGDAASAAASNSIFQALVASPAGVGKAETVRACTIAREVTLNEVKIEDVIERASGGYGTYAYDPQTVAFMMGSPSGRSLKGGKCGIFDFRMTLHVADPARLRDVRLTSFAADDWAQVRIDGQQIGSGPQNWTGMGLPPGKCEKNGTFYAYPNVDLKPWLTAGDHEIWLRVAVGDEGNAFAMVQATVDTTCETSERLIDLCSGYAGDAKCRLDNETVDGVVTFRNGVGTGLTPIRQTRLFERGACSLTIARDYFLRERSYRCSIDTGTLPEPDLSRGAYIIDHSTETLLADRVKTGDGSYSTSSQPFALPDRGSVPACEAICKTRAPKANTEAAVDGVVGAKQNSPTGWDTFYHACSTDNVCPTGPGEEVVSACGCLDDFPEAVVMMQTVRLGGADLICTSEAR